MNHNLLQQFTVVGISYKKADADTRGSYSIFPHQLEEFIALAKTKGIRHLFAISTCNRTEIYACTAQQDIVIQLLCEFTHNCFMSFKKSGYVLSGREAVSHLFNVGAGLDSQIIGDFEIISQFKIWFKYFKNLKATNAFLERLINTTIQISKRVKSETNLTSGATSVSYAAVQYLLRNVDQLNHKSILLFGAGKIGANTCENLLKHTNHDLVYVINRTQDKAVNLANKFDIHSVALEELKNTIGKVDVVIVATGSQYATIKPEHIPVGKKLDIIDLSMPNNVCHTVKELNGINVVNVDDLSKVTNETIAKRRKEVPKAKIIIEDLQKEFYAWLDNRQFTPMIQAFKQRLEFFQAHELKNLQKKNNDVSSEALELSNRLVQKITNQLANHLIVNKSNEMDLDMFSQIFKIENNA